jgi:chromosome segregation ATPase
MDYRNERDALRGRVEGLEQELDDAKRELQGRQGGDNAARAARLEARIAEADRLIRRLRGELSALRPKLSAPVRGASLVNHQGRAEDFSP